MPPNLPLLFFIFLTQLPFSHSLTKAQLTLPNTQPFLYNNGIYNSLFISSHSLYSCSLNTLFTYYQSPQSLYLNTPYQLTLSGVTQPTALTISTQHGIISPTLSQSSCTSDCTVQILNFCPNPVNVFHYFDTVLLTIQGLKQFTYNVICDSTFTNTTFQAGQFLIVLICFIVIILTSIYNKASAFQIRGFEVTYSYIAFYLVTEAIGGTLVLVDPSVAQIVGDIVIWFIGSTSMVICFNEIIFKFKIDKLKKTLINIKKVGIRITDIISFCLALAILLAWILNDKNWIISDLISLTVMIGTIKIFKITSFKRALVLYAIDVSLQILFSILIDVLDRSQYDDVLLNDFNNPLLIQLPTINPVFGLKCSWLPVSVTIFPGILLSYFHRFDKSRNTKIYLIASSAAFFVGAVIWIVITSLSPINFPFESITSPLMLILVILFAYNRKQIKVLWNGKFYDPEFKNQEEYDEETYNYQMDTKKADINQNLFDGLKIANRNTQEESQAESEQRQENAEESRKEIQDFDQIVSENQPAPKPQAKTQTKNQSI